MTEPESPWDRPVDPLYARGPMEVESRYPVIGKQQLEQTILDAISDDAEMRDVKVVMTGAMQASKIVAAPEGSPGALPVPILLVCWVKRSVRTPSDG